jgi:DNA-binding transcriptional regulator YdaS (Cro superfamily)
MDELREYIKSLNAEQRVAFSEAIGASIGHLRKAISLRQKLSPAVVVEIERASSGRITCEQLRPDVNWGYLRSSRSRRRGSARAGQ